MNKNDIRVVDFFSGAGGWSEGLRQQGFRTVMAIDNWAPAVETHNINHHLQDKPTDVLIFEKCPWQEIDRAIPDAEIIVGSPPCVSFSMSNKAGKADKSLGIRLIETYLRILTVKKFKKGSVLLAWYLENVPNSRNFVKEEYAFKDLGLRGFSKEMGIKEGAVALRVKDNGDILCAADYGSPQKRERFVCGELLTKKGAGRFLAPDKTHAPENYVTLGQIKNSLPAPNCELNASLFHDPNYSNLVLPLCQITDHFYDTGVYQVEWESARAAKVNHPFMGRMDFPEDENRPSRTIMATRSASTREAIIYRSEYARKGDGEYRLPTIREAACLMGFPFTYQFVGSEGTKWKQIGNAVCPHMIAAIGKKLREALGLSPLREPYFQTVLNLNSFAERSFNAPPGKKADAKFRRHPFKLGNMTVALINFHPTDKTAGDTGKVWRACVYVGSGKDFKPFEIGVGEMKLISSLLKSEKRGADFMEEFVTAFRGKVGRQDELQKMHVEHVDVGPLLKPSALIDTIAKFIEKVSPGTETVVHEELKGIVGRERVPKKQLLAMFAIGFVVQEAKRRR